MLLVGNSNYCLDLFSLGYSLSLCNFYGWQLKRNKNMYFLQMVVEK